MISTEIPNPDYYVRTTEAHAQHELGFAKDGEFACAWCGESTELKHLLTAVTKDRTGVYFSAPKCSVACELADRNDLR